MSGWTNSPSRSRWGDDDDHIFLGQRSQYWSPEGDVCSGGAAAALGTWGNTLGSNFHTYSYPGQRCATPVHCHVPLSPLSRSPRRQAGAPEACQGCGKMSRTVASCTEDKCYVSVCITCRVAFGWRSCDSCGQLVCGRHSWPYSFDTRECCGLHMLTADAYYLCGSCVPELDFMLPNDEQREDDDMHGVFYCTRCGRDTCCHARFCRSCGYQNEVQKRMEIARRVSPTFRVHRDFVTEKLSCLDNKCLAKDILQFHYYGYEPALPQPEPVVHLPMRRVGGRGRTATKHARRANPVP